MAKRIINFLSVVILVFSLNACGSGDTEKQTMQPQQTENQIIESASSIPKTASEESKTGEDEMSVEEEASKVLIAYFSWAENAVQDDIDVMTSASVKAPGNVAQFALWIAEETGGKLFPIQVMEPYPADWDGCLNRANKEKSENTRPKLVQMVEDIESYDVIFLGYPNWWYSCPMAIFSFIEAHDLSGKQIYLFCLHGTGGLARSVQDISEALPDSSISENVFDAYAEETDDSQGEIEKWLISIGYKK